MVILHTGLFVSVATKKWLLYRRPLNLHNNVTILNVI